MAVFRGIFGFNLNDFKAPVMTIRRNSVEDSSGDYYFY